MSHAMMMGSREIRRVPLDFDWPVNKVWKGYLTPDELHLPECPDCQFDGHCDGLSREARAIDRTFYPHMIGGPDADAQAWGDKLGQAEVDHLVAKGRLKAPVTAAEVNSQRHIHDAINRWLLTEFRCERLGIEYPCARCKGECHIGTPEQVAAYEAWEPYEPPTGDGYQAWETVSEGSPITPVFATSKELFDYLAANVHAPASREFWPAETWAQALGGDVFAIDVHTGELVGGDAS